MLIKIKPMEANMFDPKLTFIDQKESKEEMKEVRAGTKGCLCWWDRHSKCEYLGGCVTTTWTKTTQ